MQFDLAMPAAFTRLRDTLHAVDRYFMAQIQPSGMMSHLANLWGVIVKVLRVRTTIMQP